MTIREIQSPKPSQLMRKYDMRPSLYRNRTKQLGLSLIELMVAVTIGLILVAGVIQIYVGSKDTYRTQDALSRLQENQRFVLNLLASDIRSSGYIGCLNLKAEPSINIIANNPPESAGITAIQGSENKGGQTWAPGVPTGVSQVLSDTDVLVVQHGGACGARLTGNMGVRNADIQIDSANSCGFQAGEAILISDCGGADLFRATTVSSGSGKVTIAHSQSQNTNNFLSKPYTDESELLKFTSAAYFIRNGVSGIPALWRFDRTTAAGTNNPVELVEGVENLQVLYGQDTDVNGEADQYVAADAVGNWDNVVSVRMTLLFRTIEPVHAANTSYTFAAASNKTYSDRFSRQETTLTVDLRNKGS